MLGRMHSMLRLGAAALLASAALGAPALANQGAPYTGPIPSEVKAHLARLDRYPAADYFKFTPATLVDLNGDGAPELVVDGGLDDGGNTAFAIYERKRGRYVVIGEPACERVGFTLEQGGKETGGWMTFVCSDGTRLPFDEAHHRYGQLRAEAKARKVAAKRRRR